MVRYVLGSCVLLGALTMVVAGQPTRPAPPPAPPVATVVDVEVGPLFNQADADKKCPGACKPPATWDRTWHTTKPNKMSVCGCATPAASTTPPPAPVMVKGKVRDVEAGPLFDQAEAAEKCPKVCTPPAKWNGGWRTTKPTVMSVCACEDPPVPAPAVVIRSVDTGPIRSASDAKKKCAKACAAPLRWSGEWRAQGRRAATCDCIEPPPAAPPQTPPTTTPRHR